MVHLVRRATTPDCRTRLFVADYVAPHRGRGAARARRARLDCGARVMQRFGPIDLDQIDAGRLPSVIVDNRAGVEPARRC